VANHILFAYNLDRDGVSTALGEDKIGQALKAEGLAWVHLDANHKNTTKWLADELSDLDPFIFSALMADETRPRMTQVCHDS